MEVERRDENTSLIRWAASGSQAARPTDSALRIHDDGDSMPDPESGEEDVWVDRYASLPMELPRTPCCCLAGCCETYKSVPWDVRISDVSYS